MSKHAHTSDSRARQQARKKRRKATRAAVFAAVKASRTVQDNRPRRSVQSSPVIAGDVTTSPDWSMPAPARNGPRDCQAPGLLLARGEPYGLSICSRELPSLLAAIRAAGGELLSYCMHIPCGFPCTGHTVNVVTNYRFCVTADCCADHKRAARDILEELARGLQTGTIVREDVSVSAGWSLDELLAQVVTGTP
jgi:hypothetical protein